VAISLNNLAALYRAQGQYAQAEPLFKRSLAILAKALGPDHPDAFERGDYGAAVPIYRRLADAGDVEANRRLGDILRFGGSGVGKDEAEAGGACAAPDEVLFVEHEPVPFERDPPTLDLLG
jgi:TPR repeat protein